VGVCSDEAVGGAFGHRHIVVPGLPARASIIP
jgi:hypothetical protein